MRVALQPGTLFHNRFVITRLLGAGGMGSVYLAEQIDVKRRVALKVMHSDHSDNQQDKHERFLREFQVLSRLHHANIVTFYSAAISDDGLEYAVCEYITGKSLQSILLEENRLSWSRVAKIGSQICDALTYAHENSVVHRDLKPANIMLLNSPEPDTVKIIDFGLAKITGGEGDLIQRLTLTGELVGSPHYMSPEQILGKTVDARSDIYALACIILECLCGRKLFDSGQAISIIRSHVQDDPLNVLEQEFSREEKRLISCLAKALSKDPKERQKTALEFKEDLIEVCSKHDASALARVPKKGSQARIITAIFALLFFLLFLSAGIYYSKREAQVPAAISITNRDPQNQDDVLLARANRNQLEVERIEQRLKQEPDKERKVELLDELMAKSKKLGELQAKLDLKDKQLETYQRVLKYSNISASPLLVEADTRENIAKVLIDIKKFDEAKVCLNKAQDCLNRSHEETAGLRARWFLANARLYTLAHNFDEAREMFIKARKEWERIGEVNFLMPIKGKAVNFLARKPMYKETSLDLYDIGRVSKLFESSKDVEAENDAERLGLCKLLIELSDFFIDFKSTKNAANTVSKTSKVLNSLPKDQKEYKQLKIQYKKLKARLEDLENLEDLEQKENSSRF